MAWFRRSQRSTPDRPDLIRLLHEWVPVARGLPPDERDYFVDLTTLLVRGLRWEAAVGMEVTDAVVATIAGHAALLTIGLDDALDAYIDVTSVIVHATTFDRPQVHSVGNGIVTAGTGPLIGEAHHGGPVLIAWDAAARQAKDPFFGENVVIHEFAHRLDMQDGLSDGTPAIQDADLLARWGQVCARTLERIRDREEPSVLRSYAATNPSEFFAVACEVFFTRPIALREEDPALYDLLRTYFGQDTAARPHYE